MWLWIITILLVILGLAFLGYGTYRLMKMYWNALARLGEEVGKSSEKLSTIAPPVIPDKPAEAPLATKERIRLERECGRARRLARTIGRWSGDLSD